MLTIVCRAKASALPLAGNAQTSCLLIDAATSAVRTSACFIVRGFSLQRNCCRQYGSDERLTICYDRSHLYVEEPGPQRDASGMMSESSVKQGTQKPCVRLLNLELPVDVFDVLCF